MLSPRRTKYRRHQKGRVHGLATMQWDPIPEGVFKDKEAVKIIERIYAVVEGTE